MNDAKRELLINYIKSNVGPILVDFVEASWIANSIILPANCKMKELNGHYENTEFLPPEWLNNLINNKDQTILIIDKIDSISKEEQTKFTEILKYRQVSTFEIPENTVIIVTANKIDKNTINDEIYSLVVHI